MKRAIKNLESSGLEESKIGTRKQTWKETKCVVFEKRNSRAINVLIALFRHIYWLVIIPLLRLVDLVTGMFLVSPMTTAFLFLQSQKLKSQPQ
jgi:hypothetical protein